MQAGNARPGLSARLIGGPAHRTPSVAKARAARDGMPLGSPPILAACGLPGHANPAVPAAPNFKLSLAVGVLLPMLIHVMIILV